MGETPKPLSIDAPQMPCADAHLGGEFRHGSVGQRAVLDASGDVGGQAVQGVYAGIAGGEFRSAAQAGPKSGPLGGGSGAVKVAVLQVRRSGGADRTAVNTRRAYTHKEQAVEARIMREQSVIADVGIEFHAPIIANFGQENSPFSDMNKNFHAVQNC